MQRHNRLKLPPQMTQYSSDDNIHKIIDRLFTKDNPSQDRYLCSILRKRNGSTLLDNTVIALRDFRERINRQVWDSHTLGGLYGVLDVCGFADTDPSKFLKSLKAGETVTNRIMNVINSNPNLIEELDHSPELKAGIDERIQFIDDHFEDIKLIDDLINRIDTLKAENEKKAKATKPQSFFSKINLFKKDRDDHDNSHSNLRPTLK